MAFLRTRNRNELLVWGYIRNIVKLYKTLNIPLDINRMIHLYQRNCDEWSQKYKSKYISIDADISMVTINRDYKITMYGEQVITEGIFIWRIKIIANTGVTYKDYPYIGIIEDNIWCLTNYLEDTDFEGAGYQLCGGDGCLYHGLCGDKNMTVSADKCIWTENGDIIGLELDLTERKLSIQINDGGFVELFTNIKRSSVGYRLALGVRGCEGSQFQLL